MNESKNAEPHAVRQAREDRIAELYELLAAARDEVEELEEQLREMGEEPLA